MEDILRYAKENSVPIIQKEGLDFLLDFIKKNNIKSVLEIGTAIGYSSINMALCGVNVVTIERDYDYYCTAYENIKKFGLFNKIKLIYSDAMLYYPDRNFDLIFIDGAKAQSIVFLNQFKKYLNSGGYVIVDNINFHNCTYGEENLSRDLRELVTKIRRYVEYIKAENDFETQVYNVGDGLCLSRYIKDLKD